MDNPAKPRSEHRGQQVPHFGQDHFEKSDLERAVPPETGTNVSEVARKAVEACDNVSDIQPALGNIMMHDDGELTRAKADLDGEKGVPRAG